MFLLPRTSFNHSKAHFIRLFRQAALAEGTLLETRGAVRALLWDPKEQFLPDRDQRRLRHDLLEMSTHLINPVFSRALQRIEIAAMISARPDNFMTLVTPDTGTIDFVPIASGNPPHTPAACSRELITAAMEDIATVQGTLDVLIDMTGFYTSSANINPAMASHLNTVESDARALSQRFLRHAATPQSPDTEMAADLASSLKGNTTAPPSEIETALVQMVYIEMAANVAITHTLVTAYRCLRTAGQFQPTYLKDHPEVVKLMEASGVLQFPGRKPC